MIRMVYIGDDEWAVHEDRFTEAEDLRFDPSTDSWTGPFRTTIKEDVEVDRFFAVSGSTPVEAFQQWVDAYRADIISPALVKKEAQRRILDPETGYPVHEQLNTIGTAGEPAMRAFIDSIRAASDRLESMALTGGIPIDFADDKYWLPLQPGDPE